MRASRPVISALQIGRVGPERSKPRRVVALLDRQLRRLADRANPQAQYVASVCLQRLGGIMPGLDQATAQRQHGSISLRYDAQRARSVAAGEGCTDQWRQAPWRRL